MLVVYLTSIVGVLAVGPAKKRKPMHLIDLVLVRGSQMSHQILLLLDPVLSLLHKSMKMSQTRQDGFVPFQMNSATVIMH